MALFIGWLLASSPSAEQHGSGVVSLMSQELTETKVVIGITGPSRCGKGRVVEMLTHMLEGRVAVIGQDHFWRRACRITLPNGQTRMSEEEAECHDFDAL